MSRILPLLKDYKKVVLGDREFCSVDLAKWLRTQEKTYFCLRLKKSEYVKQEKEVWETLEKIGLAPGLSLYLKGVKVTKTKEFDNINIAAKWKRKYRGWTAAEENDISAIAVATSHLSNTLEWLAVRRINEDILHQLWLPLLFLSPKE